MSFIITLILILVAVFFTVVLIISVVTALWKAMHDILTGLFTWIFKSGYAIIMLLLFFWFIFKIHEHAH